MPKSAEDIKKLLQLVFDGAQVPEKAIRYWQARLLKGLSWSEVGGKAAYYKRQGYGVRDFGDPPFDIPKITIEEAKKPALMDEQIIQKDVLKSGGKIPKSIGIVKELNDSIKKLQPIKAAKNTVQSMQKKTDVGGGVEFGSQATRNLFLPFVAIAAVVVVLWKIFD